MDPRALFLGSKVKVVVTALGLLTASVGGAFTLGLVGAPYVVGVENRFGAVSEGTTLVETDLVIHNPNPIGVRLGGTTVNYTVMMNDVAMASGQKEGLDVDAGNTTLEFTTGMRNDRIPPWWVSHIKAGERTNVTIDAKIHTSILGNRQFDVEQNRTVQTDIIGQFNSDEVRPVNGPENPLYSNPVLYINETTAEWGAVDQQETPIDMTFTVYNPQLKPYTITEVGYAITMNGIAVGEGTTDQAYVVPGGATETIQTRPTIANQRLDEWWVSHLRNDQVTTLRIDFYAKVELPTGQQIRVPLDRLTYEKTIETDIFGTKAEGSGSATGDASTPTPTDDGSTPSPGGSPVSTPTATGVPIGGGDDGTPTGTDTGGIIG